MASFDCLSYDLVYWFVDEYFGTGPIFQLILLQFVCKRLRNGVLQPRCRTRLEKLHNTAPAYRKNVFSDMGAEACRYLSVARWLQDRSHFQLDGKWYNVAARCKYLSLSHICCFLLLIWRK